MKRNGKSLRLTLPGDDLRNSHVVPIMMVIAINMPNNGETKMNATVVQIFSAPSTAKPPLVTPAPSNPPTSACDELEGKPNHQVSKFQKMAPPSAPNINAVSTTLGS